MLDARAFATCLVTIYGAPPRRAASGRRRCFEVQVNRGTGGNTTLGRWHVRVSIVGDLDPEEIDDLADSVVAAAGSAVHEELIKGILRQTRVIGMFNTEVIEPITAYASYDLDGYKVYIEVTFSQNDTLNEQQVEQIRLAIRRTLALVGAVAAADLSSALFVGSGTKSGPSIIGLEKLPPEIRPLIEEQIRQRMGGNGADVAVVEVGSDDIGLLFDPRSNGSGIPSLRFGMPRR